MREGRKEIRQAKRNTNTLATKQTQGPLVPLEGPPDNAAPQVPCADPWLPVGRGPVVGAWVSLKKSRDLGSLRAEAGGSLGRRTAGLSRFQLPLGGAASRAVAVGPPGWKEGHPRGLSRRDRSPGREPGGQDPGLHQDAPHTPSLSRYPLPPCQPHPLGQGPTSASKPASLQSGESPCFPPDVDPGPGEQVSGVLSPGFPVLCQPCERAFPRVYEEAQN